MMVPMAPPRPPPPRIAAVSLNATKQLALVRHTQFLGDEQLEALVLRQVLASRVWHQPARRHLHLLLLLHLTHEFGQRSVREGHQRAAVDVIPGALVVEDDDGEVRHPQEIHKLLDGVLDVVVMPHELVHHLARDDDEHQPGSDGEAKEQGGHLIGPRVLRAHAGFDDGEVLVVESLEEQHHEQEGQLPRRDAPTAARSTRSR